jgi:alpha-amylase
MGKVYFLFGIHNHQPVGNFDFVFKEAYDKCYFPFLSILKSFPKIKCSIHNSGPLYDWMADKGSEYLDILKKLVKSGQVEIISGGYYEPILPLISDNDKKGQVRFMNEFIKKEFKTRAGGMWLAERVWEPYLARVINSCGLKFTFLDDTHFRYAGCNDKEFFGYYTTEDGGKPIFIFPISKTLRYKIPFSQPHEAIDILNSFRKNGDVLVTLFDDGEKFGLWPHTYEWVYEKEWLKQFFTLLQEQPFIETINPSGAIEKFRTKGIVYLPTASYEEMGEWVLEPKNFFVYEELNNFLKENNKFDGYSDFVRGGFFRNFYKKYSRLNYMHKKMLYLSEKINKQTVPGKDKEIFDNLWQAQTNCGYWHGIFGGFYLGHIRASVYEKLIQAENLFDKKFDKRQVSVENADFDLDGAQEIILKNKKIICCFSSKGGALVELSLRDKAFNLLNTITRQEESYHAKIKAKVNSGNKVGTIHDIVTQKDDNLDKFLTYDQYERLCLVDHLLDKNLTIGKFNAQEGIRTLSDKFYNYSIEEAKKEVGLKFKYKNNGLDFLKTVSFSNSCGFSADYDFNNKNSLNNYNFGVEFNLALLSPEHIFKKEGRRQIPLKEPRIWNNIGSLEIIDCHKNIALKFKFDKADVYTLPVYSVSSSESGFEKVYQQVTVLFIFKNVKEGIKLIFGVDNLVY